MLPGPEAEQLIEEQEHLPWQLFALRVHMLLRIKKQQLHKGPEFSMSKDLEER